jgi:hypothetical protein
MPFFSPLTRQPNNMADMNAAIICTAGKDLRFFYCRMHNSGESISRGERFFNPHFFRISQEKILQIRFCGVKLSFCVETQ